jgi:hypothetical protein
VLHRRPPRRDMDRLHDVLTNPQSASCGAPNHGARVVLKNPTPSSSITIENCAGKRNHLTDGHPPNTPPRVKTGLSRWCKYELLAGPRPMSLESSNTWGVAVSRQRRRFPPEPGGRVAVTPH